MLMAGQSTPHERRHKVRLLRFRLRRKLRPLPLLRLSPRDPLRWARAGTPISLAEKKTGRTRKGYAASVSGKAANGCAVDGPKEKNATAGRSAQARTSGRRRGKVGAPSRQSGTETRSPWGCCLPGEVPDTLLSSFRWRYPGCLPGFPFYNPVFQTIVYRQGSEQAGPEGQAFQ